MARYDADGYRETIQGVQGNRRQIKGYSREEMGGADRARARSDARREAHYASRLPDRSIAAQSGQFRNPDGSVKADRGQTVPSFGGGTKTVMPQSKAVPREKLPATIQRPAEESVALDAGKRMVDRMVPPSTVPPSTVASGLNDIMTSLGRKKRASKVLRPIE